MEKYPGSWGTRKYPASQLGRKSVPTVWSQGIAQVTLSVAAYSPAPGKGLTARESSPAPACSSTALWTIGHTALWTRWRHTVTGSDKEHLPCAAISCSNSGRSQGWQRGTSHSGSRRPRGAKQQQLRPFSRCISVSVSAGSALECCKNNYISYELMDACSAL